MNLITEENLFDYVSLPDYIIEKYKSGIISRTHLSDIIRLELLTDFGGYWIDATLYFTGKNIFKIIDKNDLFLFSHIMRGEASNFITASSWFIYAKKESVILNDTKNMLYHYWQNENELLHYWLIHLFFTISCKKNKDEWSKVSTVSNIPPHFMQEKLLSDFDERLWNDMCQLSDIHKLTYKLDISNISNDTFYNKIINKDVIF